MLTDPNLECQRKRQSEIAEAAGPLMFALLLLYLFVCHPATLHLSQLHPGRVASNHPQSHLHTNNQAGCEFLSLILIIGVIPENSCSSSSTNALEGLVIRESRALTCVFPSAATLVAAVSRNPSEAATPLGSCDSVARICPAAFPAFPSLCQSAALPGFLLLYI